MLSAIMFFSFAAFVIGVTAAALLPPLHGLVRHPEDDDEAALGRRCVRRD